MRRPNAVRANGEASVLRYSFPLFGLVGSLMVLNREKCLAIKSSN